MNHARAVLSAVRIMNALRVRRGVMMIALSANRSSAMRGRAQNAANAISAAMVLSIPAVPAAPASMLHRVNTLHI